MNARPIPTRLYAILITAVFAIFMAERLFHPAGTTDMWNDEAKYLRLAQDKSGYRLYNDEFYLGHPPGYPLALRGATWLVDRCREPSREPRIRSDYLAGIGLSLIFAALTFFAFHGLLGSLGLSRFARVVALLLLALSAEHVEMSTLIYKESMMLFLIFLALWFARRALESGRDEPLVLCGLIGTMAVLTADFAILLIPLLAVGWLLFGKGRRGWRRFAVPLLMIGCAYGAWVGVRWRFYATHEYAAVGVDGTVEKVSDFGPLQLFNPRLFPTTSQVVMHSRFAFDRRVLTKAGVVRFDRTLWLPYDSDSNAPSHFTEYIPIAGIGALVAVALVFVCRRSSPARRGALFLVAGLVLFGAPGLNLASPTRFILPAAFFAYGLAGYGLDRLAEIARRRVKWDGLSPVLLVVLVALVVTVVTAQTSLRRFVLARTVRMQGRTLATALNRLPMAGGVMLPFGHTPEAAWLSHRRVIGLEPAADDLNRTIEKMKIRYIVLNSKKKFDARYHLPKGVTTTHAYITAHPIRFRLVKRVRVTGEIFVETLLIYEVLGR